MMLQPWKKEEFRERLYGVGTNAYHHLHPFHIRMNEGTLDAKSIRLWAANRFYYQRSIPMKDAAILSNCPVREVRRKWINRIIDQDGRNGQEGGIEKWIRLAIACGLTREETIGTPSFAFGLINPMRQNSFLSGLLPGAFVAGFSIVAVVCGQFSGRKGRAQFQRFLPPFIAPELISGLLLIGIVVTQVDIDDWPVEFLRR
jgi:hypothetical protein